MQYADWVQAVQAEGGMATTWPFSDNYKGQPAAKFPSDVWSTLFNQGVLPTFGTQASADNSEIYVLATAMTGSTEVLAGAPQTMTTAQSITNATLTVGGEVAQGAEQGLSLGMAALGAPTTAQVEGALGLQPGSISSFFADAGKQILIGAGVALVVAYLVGRKR